jgi:V/A-type H+-transporting ATPase subunit E
MKAVDENFRALSRAVLHQARSESEQILADAKVKANAVRKSAEEQAKSEREVILAQARQEAERIRSEAVAGAEVQARTLQLERREKMLDSVFEAARQRLLALQQRTDYEQIVRQLVREAVVHLGASAVHIRADEKTQKLLSDDLLAELSEELNAQLQLGAMLERGIGVIAETADGHRQYDNTLQARLSRQKDALRAPVYRVLMGESP